MQNAYHDRDRRCQEFPNSRFQADKSEGVYWEKSGILGKIDKLDKFNIIMQMGMIFVISIFTYTYMEAFREINFFSSLVSEVYAEVQ